MHVELLYFLPLTNLTFPYQYRQVRESIRVDSKLDLIQLSERCLSCLYQPAVALFCAKLGSSVDIAITRSASLTRRGRADFVHRGVVIRPRQQLVFQLAQEESAALC